MARPSLLRAGIAQTEDTELRALRDVLLEYLEILAREGNSEERQVARVKQWLSLAKRVEPALSAYFESIKTVLPRAELRRRLAA
jgi:hypothetical protein